MPKRKGLLAMLAWLWLVVPAAAQAPDWSLAFQMPARGLSFQSIDRFDKIYLTDQRQNILQVDTLGLIINTFSPPLQSHVGMVEAWSHAKISVFYDDRQQVQLLDRFLIPLGQANLRDYTDGTIAAATLSADNRLWLFDETTFRLLKIDTRFTSITHETPLELLLSRVPHDITFLREYQSKLYLVDRLSGIYVFDNMGNYQTKFPLPGLSYVGFLGDELYYLANGQLHFQNLYSFKTRSITLPESPLPFRQVLAGDKYLYLLTDAALFAFRWKRE